jgi:Na+/H+-dicarboxylate symporter
MKGKRASTERDDSDKKRKQATLYDLAQVVWRCCWLLVWMAVVGVFGAHVEIVAGFHFFASLLPPCFDWRVAVAHCAWLFLVLSFLGVQIQYWRLTLTHLPTNGL